jgi:hypothetical protein
MSAYTPRASLSVGAYRGSAAILLTDTAAQLCAVFFERPGYPAPRCTFRPAFTPDAIFSFTLTKRRVEDIQNEILLDADPVAGGTKQEDGSVRYEWTLDEIEEALDFLAAACNHAEDPQIEARLDAIYRKLEKLLE